MLTGLRVLSLCILHDKAEHTAKGGGASMELNVWGDKIKYNNRYNSKSRWKKWGCLSSYHVYLWSYGC